MGGPRGDRSRRCADRPARLALRDRRRHRRDGPGPDWSRAPTPGTSSPSRPPACTCWPSSRSPPPGAIAAVPSGFTAPWVTLVVATVTLTEAQGRLAKNLRTAATTPSAHGSGQPARVGGRGLAQPRPGAAHRGAVELRDPRLRPLQGGQRPGGARRRRRPAVRAHRRLVPAAAARRPARPLWRGRVRPLPAGHRGAGAWQILRQLDETHAFGLVGMASPRPARTTRSAACSPAPTPTCTSRSAPAALPEAPPRRPTGAVQAAARPNRAPQPRQVAQLGRARPP